MMARPPRKFGRPTDNAALDVLVENVEGSRR
jgi:hypothetical protein